MRSTTETPARPLPLSIWRDRAKAQGCRTEYLARARRCGDRAVRSRDAHDARFLRAMTIVWQILAGKDADVHHAAHAPLPLNFAENRTTGTGDDMKTQFSLLARCEPTKLSEQCSHLVDLALCHPKALRLFVFHMSMASRALNPAYKRPTTVPLPVSAHARADRYGVTACAAASGS